MVVRSQIEDVEAVVVRDGGWTAWPVSWSGIWVGALSALAAAAIFGLVGIAIGAHQLGIAGQITKWSDVTRASVVVTVFAAFLAFVIGGWVTVKIAGIQSAEVAALHGAITWLVALPLLFVLLALGAGNAFGGWYGGVLGAPIWVTPANGPPDPNAAVLARNAAMAAVAALLLGLIGSVLGSWLASGQRMTLLSSRENVARSQGAR
jgi:hypothetical protein